MPLKLPPILVKELIKRGLLTQESVAELEAAMKAHNKDFDDVLLERNIISDPDLTALKAELYQVPVFDVSPADVSKDVFRDIPEDVALFYKVVPFGREGAVLKIGIINFEDIDALEALKFIALDRGFTLGKYVISRKDYDTLVRNYRTLSQDVGAALESIEEGAGSPVPQQEEATDKSPKLEEITAESPVIKIVGAVLKHAVESHASDIHIEPFEDRIRIRFRIDGVLVKTLQLPRNLHAPIVSRIKILSDLKIDETRLAQDGRFSIRMARNKIDYRVSTFPTKQGEKVVMRVLDTMANNIELDNLGFQKHSRELLEGAITKPYGAVLITGPTGSGKSTTIVGMIRRINSESINIVTLEDPIEYYLDGVNQSQIHEEIGYTFATGLRHILRQDPDVIVVGEVRDSETATLAVQAALTGHLVFSTLHTNDAMGVIPRLLDMGVEKYLLPSAVNLAVAQRLLRRLCTTCRIETKANASEEKLINEVLRQMPQEYQKEFLSSGGYTIFKPNTENPCKECGGKAYKGRIGVYEMLAMTAELERIILGEISEAALREEAKRQGMITMYQDGLLKMLQGTVSFEELFELAGE